MATTLLAALSLSLAAAPAAPAQSPLDEYQRSGRVTPCKYSPGQLNGAVPNDIEQYAPDFEAALRDAARGGCSTAKNPNVEPNPTDEEGDPVDPETDRELAAGSSYVKPPPQPPIVALEPARPATAHVPLAVETDRSTPAPIIALAVMLLLTVLAGIAAGVWRYMGWGLGPLAPLRHAFGEAGVRAGGRLDALGGRLRPGRPGPGA